MFALVNITENKESLQGPRFLAASENYGPEVNRCHKLYTNNFFAIRLQVLKRLFPNTIWLDFILNSTSKMGQFDAKSFVYHLISTSFSLWFAI